MVKCILHLVFKRVLELQGANQDEPKRLSAWLSAIFSRRICEVAPVGADFVLLLNGLIGLSNMDKLEKGFLEFATSLLHKLYMDLTMRILPRVIGTNHLFSYVVCKIRTEYFREGPRMSPWS